ncbi:MAG: hypothetical protein AAF701_10030, partial [Pseudomonadota bacterium]
TVPPTCPAYLCPDRTKTITGCAGNLCQFPPRQDLPPGAPGQSGVTYHKDGYPEVAVFGDHKNRPCSATILTPKLAMTALHCLQDPWSHFHQSATTLWNWQHLSLKQDSRAWYTVTMIVDGQETSALVSHFSVPYSPHDIRPADQNTQPKRDILLVHLSGQGLPLPPHQWPIVDFAYGAHPGALSFAGYGWTNVDSLDTITWKAAANAQKWADLRQVAFNFAEGVTPVAGFTHPLVTWKNGDPKHTGGPCRGDSGGPIYAGFNRGYWNNPRRVFGIVSGGTGQITSAAGCLSDDSIGFGEILGNYKTGICTLGPIPPRGC